MKKSKTCKETTNSVHPVNISDGFSDITFTTGLDERLQCPVCKRALRRPKQTQCGHRFCEDCIQPYLNPPRCPIDGQELNPAEIFLDRYCEREVLGLGCLCYNHTRGCQWNGELRYIQEHSEECPYSFTRCTNSGCTEQVEKRHLKDHVNNTCPHRLDTCKRCDAGMKRCEMEEHVQHCPKVVVQCTMGCGAKVSRDTINEHVATACPKAEVPCSLIQCGCDFKGTKEDINEHQIESTGEHIEQLGKKSQEILDNVTQMKEKIERLEKEKEHLENQTKSQREVLACTKQDLTTQQIKIGILEKNVSQHTREMVQLKETLQSCLQNPSANVSAMETQMKEMLSLVTQQEERMKGLERGLAQQGELGPRTAFHSANGMSTTRRLDRTDHQLAVHDIQLSEQDLKLQMLEATSYDGVYMWKINDWTSRLNEAVTGKTPSIYSPPFYVGRFGYKVCARLYPNGDGIGKGTHLSVFFVVMKGEYDALLSWPFRQKVTFSLLDQDGYRNITDTFRPDPNSSSFKRPTSAMNVASGMPQFLSHQNLQSRRYITDDTMFVKINVDRTGMVDL